jgi:beta-lactamase regulating signal transducer with metallopeptidase domain/HEAT repeat protein
MRTLIDLLNTWSGEWWPWLGHASWQSAAVAALVLGLVWAGRRWPAPLRYGLLLVALAKFAVPPMLSLPSGVFSNAGPHVATRVESEITPLSSQMIEYMANPVMPHAIAPGPQPMAGSSPAPTATETLAPVRWQTWLMLVHFAGLLVAAFWLLRQLWMLHRLRRMARALQAGPVYELFRTVAAEVGVRRLPTLMVSQELAVPVAFGVLKPTVLLPAIVAERLPQGELRTILAHELAHFRRGDLWVNTLQLGLIVVWWFHPLLWILQKAIRDAREDCCDDLLLARDVTSSEAYCEVLVRAARELAMKAPSAAALGFGENLHPLGRRLSRIMDDGLRRSAKLSLGGGLVILIVGGLLLPGLRSQEAPPAPAKPPSLPPTPAAAKLESDRKAAAEIIKKYDEEDMAMMRRRGPGVAMRQPEIVISPEIKAKSTAELFEALKGQTPGSKQQQPLMEEFLNRKDGAFTFLASLLSDALPASSGEAPATRRAAMNLAGSLTSKYLSTLPEAVPVLARWLTDSDSQIAEMAAQSLMRLGQHASSAVPALIEAVQRGNRMAAFALCRIAPESEEAVKGILEVFQNRRQSVAVRTSIVSAFTNTRSPQHWALIERALLAEFPAADRRLQRKIAYCFVRGGSKTPEAAAAIEKSIRDVQRVIVSGEFSDLTVPELTEYLREPRAPNEDVEAVGKLQSAVAGGKMVGVKTNEELDAAAERQRQMRRSGEPQPELVATLIDVLQDKSRPWRGMAASVLANMGPAAKPAAPALIAYLKERGQPQRGTAAFALHAIFLEAKDPTPLPALIEALKDDDDHVRSSAARVLGMYGAMAKDAVAAMVPLLGSEEPRVQLDVASALWKIDPTLSPKVVAALTNIVEKVDYPNENANAARLLGEMGVPAAGAVKVLKRIAADEQRDARTRDEAKKAIAKIEPGVTL